MSSTKSATGKWWIYFFLSLALTIVFLVLWPEWFWVVLPFLFTSLVKAFDWM
ncbi:MAG: hypothetical protein V3V14_04465 [Saprospiraceae bacterium]